MNYFVKYYWKNCLNYLLIRDKENEKILNLRNVIKQKSFLTKKMQKHIQLLTMRLIITLKNILEYSKRHHLTAQPLELSFGLSSVTWEKTTDIRIKTTSITVEQA